MLVVGAGDARLDRDAERILHYLIDFFDFSLEKIILGGVNVIKLSAKTINLGRIASIFSNKAE